MGIKISRCAKIRAQSSIIWAIYVDNPALLVTPEPYRTTSKNDPSPYYMVPKTAKSAHLALRKSLVPPNSQFGVDEAGIRRPYMQALFGTGVRKT